MTRRSPRLSSGFRWIISPIIFLAQTAAQPRWRLSACSRWMPVAFPGADLNRLNLSVVRYLPRALGWNLFGFVARSLSLANIKEAEADEYYVSNLAILPAAQGQGLGKHLLLHADEQARKLGLAKCSLTVAIENRAAQRLYKRQGYEIVFTKHDKNPFASYHRMVKSLNPLP
jgi:ribosomal protein S18 acetylase RimI-like enzyme